MRSLLSKLSSLSRQFPLLRRVARRMGARRVLIFLRNLNQNRSVASKFAHMVALASAAESTVEALRPAALGPLISFIVPVFNAKPGHLDDLLASFMKQREYSELILSDDGSTSPETVQWLAQCAHGPRVLVLRNELNRGIASATNAGLARSAGTWIGLLDHDDVLAPYAVSRIAAALAKAPECQFLYTDELIANAALRPVGFFLKPAWDPVLLSGVNYVNHLSVYRRDRLLRIGGLREGFQGSQDYDLVLRYTAGLASDEIIHVPYPAYVWRQHGSNFSAVFLDAATQSARRALSEHYAGGRAALSTEQALSPNLHRIRFDLGGRDWPLVSVIIPNRDSYPLIRQVLAGLLTNTSYPNIEIIVIDNGSEDQRVLALYDEYENSGVTFTARVEKEPFNFSRAVNHGIALAKGRYVLLLNNDVEIIEPSWLKEMVCCFDYPGVGVVGAKLLYPDRRIQHAGVIVGFGAVPNIGTLVGHWYAEANEDCAGPMGRLLVRQSLSAVTGACMLISRECLDRTGEFDEDIFPIAYNDIDFCLRAGEQGYRIVWTPFATLIHHESASRGSDETPQNIVRFRRAQRDLHDRYRTDVFDDPAFNPWYSKDRSDPVPGYLDRLPDPR